MELQFHLLLAANGHQNFIKCTMPMYGYELLIMGGKAACNM